MAGSEHTILEAIQETLKTMLTELEELKELQAAQAEQTEAIAQEIKELADYLASVPPGADLKAALKKATEKAREVTASIRGMVSPSAPSDPATGERVELVLSTKGQEGLDIIFRAKGAPVGELGPLWTTRIFDPFVVKMREPLTEPPEEPHPLDVTACITINGSKIAGEDFPAVELSVLKLAQLVGAKGLVSIIEDDIAGKL